MNTNQPTLPPTANAIGIPDNEPSAALGCAGGLIAMLASAAIWGAISYWTEYQIGWMAIGVGYLVGWAVQKAGNGRSIAFGALAAGLSLAGCLLGNLLFYAGIIAREEGLPFLGVLYLLVTDPSAVLQVFGAAFDVLDVLFYGLALYAGFRNAAAPTVRSAPA